MRPEGQRIIYNIGLAIGALGFIAGMTVAIIAAPAAGSIITLLFILIFGFAFGGPYLREKRSKKLLETGVKANGKIVEMWDTGITINNQPQIEMVIEVTPPTGAPFKSQIKLVISRLQTAYYQVGVTCVVKYDPNNPKTVAIESLGDSVSNDDTAAGFYGYSNPSADKMNQAFTGSPYFPGKNPQQIEEILKVNDTEVKRIMQTGIECKAIIMTSDFTNVYVNGDNPVNAFVLEVLPDNETPYQAKCFGVISVASTAKFQPGKQVWVKYDPEDKKKITLSHS